MEERFETSQNVELNAYHGTGASFNEFRCFAYFTDNYNTAQFFAKRHAAKSLVLTCALTLKNPLIVDLNGQSWGGFWLQDTQLQNDCVKYVAANDADEEEYFKEEGLTIGFLAEYAKFLGYDGLVAYNCYEEDDRTGTQYVVFKPNNIQIRKSTKV